MGHSLNPPAECLRGIVWLPGLHDLIWISSLSGRKVLPQFLHGTNCFCDDSNASWFIRSKSLPLWPDKLGKMLGLTGGCCRKCFGSLLFSSSHFFMHCGSWMLMDFVPNSLPHMKQTTVLGFLGGWGLLRPKSPDGEDPCRPDPSLEGSKLLEGLRGLQGLQLRWCTGSRSGLNVRPQFSQGTSWLWEAWNAISFMESNWAALSRGSVDNGVFPHPVGLCGGLRRKCRGNCAFSISHFSRHFGMCSEIDVVPYNRPQM